MPATRPRRIVRRAVMVLAGVVLLPVWYVGSYGSAHWLTGRGELPHSALRHLNRTAFYPLEWYGRQHGMPGADAIRSFPRWCYHNANGVRE